MQTSPYTEFTRLIVDLFRSISDTLQPLGIPFGPIAWFYILTVVPLLVIILVLVVRKRTSTRDDVAIGIQRIVASTGDISSGISGAKKLSYIKNPSDALIFLKIEENAVQQALAAIEYYSDLEDLSEDMRQKLVSTYQQRMEAVRAAIAKDEQFKEMLDSSSAVDRARSDYLRKLEAMSGKAVEADESGPPSVGVPGEAKSVEPQPSGVGSPGGSPPSGGPPGGSPPSGGPPGGSPPSGGPPGGSPPSGSPPGGSPPSGSPPGGSPPSGSPPGGSPPSGGPPGGSPPEATSPTGASSSGGPKTGGPKSSLQSEMLAEMERLKTLMGGD